MNARRVTRTAALAGVALAALALPRFVVAQGNCEVNNQASCTVGGTAAYAINLTITTTARLSTPVTSAALPQPEVASFDAGFGSAISVPFTVRSNTSWSVGIAALSTTWAGVPASARQDKPNTDLQWGLGAGGPFFDVPASPSTSTVQSGTATGTASFNLWLRARYTWALDLPGAYDLPIRVLLTAP